MTIDAATGFKIESCLDAARACSEAMAFMRITPALAADTGLANSLSEAARVASLTADCLGRVPDIREMVLRVCVEVSERAALACARHRELPELLGCGEALAACAAFCKGAPELEMTVNAAAASADQRPGAGAVH